MASAVSPGAQSGFDYRQFEKATDVLMQEHRVIERVLDVVEKLVGAGNASPELWSKAVDFIRNFADKCHHLKEEELLFPAMEEKGVPIEGGPIGVMLEEHVEGRAYVKAMAAALSLMEKDAESGKKDLFENADAYVHLLREHIGKEDDILFVMADQALGADGQRELLRRFEEHEVKEMGTEVHAKYLRIAQELEESVKGL